MRDEKVMAQVKEILAKVSKVAPGKSVELRIPPYAAIQCVEGTTHRRGTPPNVVEMDAKTLAALADGSLTWNDGIESGAIQASGTLSDLSKVFESFHRGKNAENIQGTGLGLQIVKQFVEMHSGKIEVTSKLGVGTKVAIDFPAFG